MQNAGGTEYAVLCPLAVGSTDLTDWCVVVIVPRVARKDATCSIFLFECDVVIRKRNSTADRPVQIFSRPPPLTFLHRHRYMYMYMHAQQVEGQMNLEVILLTATCVASYR